MGLYLNKEPRFSSPQNPTADQHNERICNESANDSNVLDADGGLSILLAIAGFLFRKSPAIFAFSVFFV